MSTSTLHTVYAVSVNGTVIDEITGVRIGNGMRRMIQGVGGDVEPKFVSLQEQEPVIGFTTMAIARALAAIGINGVALSSTAVLFWQKMLIDSVRAGATSHFKMTVNAGMVIPRTLRMAQGQHATLEYDIICRYDGTNEPVVLAVSQSLAGSPAADQFFTVGKATINGADLTGIKDITIDFGIQPITDISGGDIWPTFCAIQARVNPMITIRSNDALSYNTFGLDGTAQGATDSIIYCRKMAADGAGRVSNATEEHVSFTIDAGHIGIESQDANHPDAVQTVITIAPVFDGTNAVFVIDTTAAIA